MGEFTLRLLDDRFSVCKIGDAGQADVTCPFTFLSVTDEEISLVCPEHTVPAAAIEREDGWRCLKLEGILEFSLIGVIAGISAILAGEGISLFAVSTYNTDYILVREAMLDKTLDALRGEKYAVKP